MKTAVHHRQERDRRVWGVPLHDIPNGAFEGAMYAWCLEPPEHSARLEHGIYVKTCNAIVCPNTGISWSLDSQHSDTWHVVGYRKLTLEPRNWWGRVCGWFRRRRAPQW